MLLTKCIHKFLSAALLLAAASASGIEPADPDLIPAARNVLNYLESVYGKKVLAGMNGERNHAGKLYDKTGKKPSVVNIDLSGWNSDKYTDIYNRTAQSQMEQLKNWWEEDGMIPTLTWHWSNPMQNSGGFDATKSDYMAMDVGNAVTPGTDEYQRTMNDIERHADYMQILADAGVPVLFRPLHEIDGGWFWWTDCNQHENTAQLYRILFDYMVNEREFHNLIWVYNTGLKICNEDDVASIEARKRFYPGDEYIDISGIDIYPNDWFGWADNKEDGYLEAFEIMSQVTPGKILALSECQGAPNPDVIADEGPMWLYFLPWWDDADPDDYVQRVYDHDVFLTLDEIPDLKNVTGIGGTEPRHHDLLSGSRERWRIKYLPSSIDPRYHNQLVIIDEGSGRIYRTNGELVF
jgi:mannan endo-1,4-beta-mannosidase